MTSQFDVVINKSPTSKQFPYFLILQHRLLNEFESVVVVPIRPAKGRTPATKLVPSVEIEGILYHIVMYSIAAVSWNIIGETVANIHSIRDEIIRAYDIIVSGV